MKIKQLLLEQDSGLTDGATAQTEQPKQEDAQAEKQKRLERIKAKAQKARESMEKIAEKKEAAITPEAPQNLPETDEIEKKLADLEVRESRLNAREALSEAGLIFADESGKTISDELIEMIRDADAKKVKIKVATIKQAVDMCAQEYVKKRLGDSAVVPPQPTAVQKELNPNELLRRLR